MRQAFCPFICAACEFAVFNECADLKRGNWEVLGKGVQPRCVPDPRGHAGYAEVKDEGLQAMR
jgi:hypothetical protein